MTTCPSPAQQHRDPKGSTVRGLARFGADIIAGRSTAMPGESPLEHARRLQRDHAEPRPVMVYTGELVAKDFEGISKTPPAPLPRWGTDCGDASAR